jgi:tetratricopeptide (TPR) repeat protein
MSDDKAQIEEAAKSENNWVRARIFKQDLPQTRTLLQVAERARDMAANSLGTQHPAYAGALLNLGVYYDFVEHETVKAQELFEQARAILDQTQAGATLYAEALFELGAARNKRKLATDDPQITKAYLNVHRRLSAKRLAAEESRGSGPWIDRLDEACIYHSLDEETAAANPTAKGWEERFASSLLAIAEIIIRHLDYLRESKASDAWGCTTPPQVYERLAAFAPTDSEWLRQLAEAYDVIGNEQSGADQLASFRAALFFREQLIALEQLHVSTLRRVIDQSAPNNNEQRPLTILASFIHPPARQTRTTPGPVPSDGKAQEKAQDKARSEQSARSENEWVRARIMKREAPAQESLLQIAERARETAGKSLGMQHPAYAVSLQNLGFYYEVIENDAAKAKDFYERARKVVALPLAEGLHALGIFHLQTTNDPKKAEAALTEALAIQRDALNENDYSLAETMRALADAKTRQSDFDSAIELNNEVLAIQSIHDYCEGGGVAGTVADTLERIQKLQTLRRAGSAGGGDQA